MPKIISRCKAIYAYSPNLDDELEINPGLDAKIPFKAGPFLTALSFQGI